MHNYLRKTVIMAIMAIVCASCKPEGSIAPPLLPPEKLPFSLDLVQRRVRMSIVAPYDTLTLSATLRTAGRDIISDGVITFESTDSALRVTPEGFLTARSVREGVAILVTGKSQGIRFVDTAFVDVTSETDPPKLASFSIQNPLGTSNVFAVSDTLFALQITVAALDISGDTLFDVIPAFSSTRTAAAMFDASGYIYAMKPGEITVYASTTYYGVTRRDSIKYIIAPPLFAYVYLNSRIRASDAQREQFFQPDTVVIGAGGWVGWVNNVRTVNLDVMFDTPSAATPGCSFWFGCGGEIPETGGTGNIASFVSDTTVTFGNARFRRFNTPGTYTFRSTVATGTGVVVVR